MLEEVEKLNLMINSLLTIAQADSGSIELKRSDIRLVIWCGNRFRS